MKKISVVTVVYNGEKFLEGTIKSVIEQTYKNIEYIIIDGGSNDYTLDIIKKYEKNLTCWVTEKDKGIYDAMNKGIDFASGEWIVFMNAGDSFYRSETVEKISDYLDTNYGVVCGSANYVFSDSDSKIKFLSNNLGPFHIRFSHHQASFIRADLMKKYKYDINFKIRGEIDFFAKIFTNGEKWRETDIVVCNYDVGGVSSTVSWCHFIEEITIGRRYIPMYGIKHFLYYLFRVIPRFILRKMLPSWLESKVRAKFSS